jgi:hypothetical protein
MEARMSKNINVNPAHYKLAGRERQGENVIQSVQRQAFAQQKAETDRWREKEAPPAWETTPPAPPVTQEDRDQAIAIASVQDKQRRARTKRAVAKRTPAKRVTRATRKASPARRSQKRRTGKPTSRRAR